MSGPRIARFATIVSSISATPACTEARRDPSAIATNEHD